MNDKTEQKIIDRIKELADQLTAEHQQWTRSRLARELQKEQMVNCDSAQINVWVNKAYTQNHNDAHLQTAYLCNDESQSLTDCEQIEQLLQNGQTEQALQQVSKDLDATGHLLQQALQQLQNFNPDAPAEELYAPYAALACAYHETQASLQKDVNHFARLRSHITRHYYQYVIALTDVYGESVRKVCPEIFLLENVDWLNVGQLLKRIPLEMDFISSECATLIAQLTVNNAEPAFTSKLERLRYHLGKALAAAQPPYTRPQQQEATLKAEKEKLSRSAQHDSHTLETELNRLNALHQNLILILLPQITTFLQNSQQLAQQNIESQIEALYTDPEVNKPQSERTLTLERCHWLENELTDHQDNIQLYSSWISSSQKLLQIAQEKYNKAVQSRPTVPNVLVNVLTIGFAKSHYQNRLNRWTQQYQALTEVYEQMRTLREQNEQELTEQTNSYQKKQADYRLQKAKVMRLSRDVRDALTGLLPIREKMLSYLQPAIHQLQLARQITDRQPDSPAKFTPIDTTACADAVEKYSSWVRKNLEANQGTQLNNGPLQQADEALINQGVNLVYQIVKHDEAEMARGSITLIDNQKYEEALALFEQNMTPIADKKGTLRSILLSIHGANDNMAIRRAVSELGEQNGTPFTLKEIDNLLKTREGENNF